MNRSTHSISKSVLCIAWAMAVVAPVLAQDKGGVRRGADPEAKSRAAVQAREERFLTGTDRIAREQYETKAAEMALRIDDTAAASRENAALLYHQALLATTQVLSTRPLDARTLTWLKGQFAPVPGTPFEPAQALHKGRDAELQFWRTRPQGRPFTRELVLGKIPDANDRRDLTVLTDDQLLVLALQAEQRVPGRYGISAPPQLLARARQACDQYLQSALQIMKADLPYREKHAHLQAMVDSLDDRAIVGDPIAILAEAYKVVEICHRLLVRNAVYDNLVTTAIEILLVKARTGQLPRVLPRGLPKDLYTNKGFEYERTEQGFVLRFDPDNLSRIQVRQFEFRTRDGGS